MKYNIVSIGVLLIPIVVNGILTHLRRIKTVEKGKVYFSKLFVILGTITSITSLISALITVFTDQPIWISIVFLALSLLGATLIIAFVNCKISYDEKGFVHKNFFGFKKIYTYDQVTSIKECMHESYIYVGKHRVMIDKLSTGGVEFILFVKKKYKALHNGQNLPQKNKS